MFIKGYHFLFYILILYSGFLTFSRGFYSFPSFILLSFTLVLLLYKVFIDNPSKEKKKLELIEQEFFLLCLIFEIIAIFFVEGLYQQKIYFFYSNCFLIVLSILVTLSYKFSLQPIKTLAKNSFVILLGINFLIRIFVLLGSPEPHIDTFYSLKEASQAMGEYKNPYNIQYSQVYANVKPYTFFPYPPAILIFELPFHILFRDPRILFILSTIITSILIKKIIVHKNRNLSTLGELVAISYAFFPISFFILEQSWIDVFIGLLIATYAYLELKKSSRTLGIILGLIFLTKQYLLISPMFLIEKFYKKTSFLIGFLLTILLLISLFFRFDYIKLYDIYNPERFGSRYDSLSFVSFLKITFDINWERKISLIIWSFLALIILIKKYKSINSHYLLFSVWLICFFYFSYTAFVNEYFLGLITTYIAYSMSLILLIKKPTTSLNKGLDHQKRAQ